MCVMCEKPSLFETIKSNSSLLPMAQNYGNCLGSRTKNIEHNAHPRGDLAHPMGVNLFDLTCFIERRFV